MTDMVKYHGYFWPARADANVLRYISHSADMAKAYKYVGEFKLAVQAGGHCGIWPLALSQRFQHVVTFEPMADNFNCLLKNTEKATNIESYNACLGREPTSISMRFNTKNTGGHKGMPVLGDTPVVTIDGLQLPRCDLIVLDVEGMELPALIGGAKTIAAFSPVLMLEDCDHGSRFGWGSSAELHAYLKKLGYRVVEKVARDIVCARP